MSKVRVPRQIPCGRGGGVILAAVAAVLLAACSAGASPAPAVPAGAPSAAPTVAPVSSMTSSAPASAAATVAPASSMMPSAPASAAAPAAGGHALTIADFAFSPATITVTAGTTLTWTNTGTVAHTVTANDGSFDSGHIAPGSTFSHTFASAGTFAYHCAIHPFMTGNVVVTP